MVNDSMLFAAQQELSRALSIVQEAQETAQAADEGHGTPEHAAERAQAAAAALGRCRDTVQGLWFLMRRSAVEFAKADKRERVTGVEHRGGAA